jgi:hypothetical protein
MESESTVDGYSLETRLRLRIITLTKDFLIKSDHINGNTLDNRRENLRIVKKDENQQNRKGANKNSKSGILGIFWIEHCKR